MFTNNAIRYIINHGSNDQYFSVVYCIVSTLDRNFQNKTGVVWKIFKQNISKNAKNG